MTSVVGAGPGTGAGRILRGIGSLRALVIGDVILDRYCEGTVRRVSPEGPFPVVEQASETASMGGAANAAANMAALGADVSLVASVGCDPAADELADLGRAAGIDVDGLVRDSARATLVKRRVVADGHVLIREDTGSQNGQGGILSRRLAAVAGKAAAASEAVLVSDYRYGVVSDEVITALALADPPVLVVDSRRLERFRPLAPTAVTPNYDEAVALMGAVARDGPNRLDHAADMGAGILEMSGAGMAVITMDRDGALVVGAGGDPRHVPATGTCRNPCGAGDTFAAALTLALATGAEGEQAAILASRAAAVVVEKPGTAVCHARELIDPGTVTKWCATPEQLIDAVERHRGAGASIVFTNGCFDVFHAGHAGFLADAAALGDVLVVAVNSDASVRALKGRHRPYNTLADRIAVLGAVGAVDHVVAFEDDTPEELIRLVRPDVYCKGADYEGRTIPEAELVRSMGGRYVVLDHLPGHSTSILAERVSQRRTGADPSPG